MATMEIPNSDSQAFVFHCDGDSGLKFYVGFPVRDFGEESVRMALFYGQWGMPDSVIVSDLTTPELDRDDMNIFFSELKSVCDSRIEDNNLSPEQVCEGSPRIGYSLSGDSSINISLSLERSGLIFQWESQAGGTDIEGSICVPGGDYQLLCQIEKVL